jgi:hypothetical protein
MIDEFVEQPIGGVAVRKGLLLVQEFGEARA